MNEDGGVRCRQFGLLGAREVRVRGHLVEVSAARQRAVLGLLLLQVGRTVTTTQLVDTVWGRGPARHRRARI